MVYPMRSGEDTAGFDEHSTWFSVIHEHAVGLGEHNPWSSKTQLSSLLDLVSTSLDPVRSSECTAVFGEQGP